MSCRLLMGAVMAVVGLGSASAAGPVAVVSGPGDQSAPSLSISRLAYTDDASGFRQVWVRDLDTDEATQVSSGAVDHGDPDLDRATVVYTSPAGVHLVTVGSGSGGVLIPAPGAARASISTVLATWEQAGPGGRDVAFLPLGSTTPVVVPGAGDEHAPAAAFAWVAWLDESGAGSIRLRDEGGGVTTVRAGRAEKVSIWASGRLGTPILAAAVAAAGGDLDLVVLAADGAERARLTLPGTQRNPTLFGEWVGFEDLATGVSQVGVWQWSTGRVLFPSPSSGQQRLNDVTVEGSELRVAWADGRSGTLDVFLFRAALPLPDVPPGQVRCDDPLSPVVADLALTAGPRGFAAGALAFDVPREAAALACVDGVNVVAALVQVGAAVIELPHEPGTGPGPGGPGDDDHGHWHHDHGRGNGHDGGHFDRGRHRGDRRHGRGDPCEPAEPLLRHAEARLTLPAGPVAVAGVMRGWPGATLRVRVLADGWQAPARAGCLAGVDCPDPAAGVPPDPAPGRPGGGCSSGGGAGLLALLLAPALLGGRGRRRRPAAGERATGRAC